MSDMPNDQTHSKMDPMGEKSTARKQIDDNLKRVYDATLNEDVPQRFLDLLEKLKTGEGDADER